VFDVAMLDKSGPDTTKSLVHSGAFTRILGRRELSSGLKPRDWRSGLAVDPSRPTFMTVAC
jgi:hypothetical protein